MVVHMPKWVLDLFSTADSLTQSTVLIVLLVVMGALLYGNLRKRLRVKELLMERANLRNRLRGQELLACELRAELQNSMARGESLQQEVFTLALEFARL